jgi:hypothetical protein
MKFTEARRRIIQALREGSYQHEARDVVEGKNLLATGDVTSAEVAELLQRCRGDQHESQPHHFDDQVLVHFFKPTRQGEQWYIKAYLIGDPDDEDDDPRVAVFISVHKSVYRYRGRRR